VLNCAKLREDLIEQLSRQIYQDYKRAFGERRGLPLALRPVESGNLPSGGTKPKPICHLMAEQAGAAAACLDVQPKLSEARADSKRGLLRRSVRLGMYRLNWGSNIRVLQTGQVLLKSQPETVCLRAPGNFWIGG